MHDVTENSSREAEDSKLICSLWAPAGERIGEEERA